MPCVRDLGISYVDADLSMQTHVRRTNSLFLLSSSATDPPLSSNVDVPSASGCLGAQTSDKQTLRSHFSIVGNNEITNVYVQLTFN